MIDEMGLFILRVAEYLTDNLIIPPGGTVPATKEERFKEWIDRMVKLEKMSGDHEREC